MAYDKVNPANEEPDFPADDQDDLGAPAPGPYIENPFRDYPRVKVETLLGEVVTLTDFKSVRTTYGEQLSMTAITGAGEPVRVLLPMSEQRRRMMDYWAVQGCKPLPGMVFTKKTLRDGRTFISITQQG